MMAFGPAMSPWCLTVSPDLEQQILDVPYEIRTMDVLSSEHLD